jgi:putative transcriptional regulator
MIRFHLKQLIADKEFQENRRVKLEEIAAATGIHRTTLSKIANKKGWNATTDTLDKLCQYFGCSLDMIAEFIEDKSGKRQ